jgi:hypothetical protein
MSLSVCSTVPMVPGMAEIVAESNHRSECHSELLGPLLWGKTKRFLDGRNIPITFGVA